MSAPRQPRANVRDDIEVELVEIDGQELAVLTLPAPRVGAATKILSAAERHVFQAIREGKSNEQIAALRGTSPRTVANQLASIFAKLGVSSRHELCALSDATSKDD